MRISLQKKKLKFYVSYVPTYILINSFFQTGRNIPCLKHIPITHIFIKAFHHFWLFEITFFTSGFLLGIWIIGWLCICRSGKVIKKLQKTGKAPQKQEATRPFKKRRGNLNAYTTQVFLPGFFSSALPPLLKCFTSE